MTRAQQEKQVLDQIEQHKGMSIFWVTAYMRRAHAAMRLQDRGKIISHKDDPRDAYPWMVFSIREEDVV